MRRFSINELLNPPTLTGRKVKLRPKYLADAINDYRWRTDPELCSYDATQPLTFSFEEYLKYFSSTLCKMGQDCLLAIETLDGKHIGNCGYFNIDKEKKEAEYGIMIGDRKYWECGYGSDAIFTLTSYIFTHTNLVRIYLKTLDWNIRAQKCFIKCGFSVYGKILRDGYIFITMEVFRPHPTSSP